MVVFWIIVAVVAVALGALAWWTSGRQRRGVDAGRAHANFYEAQAKAVDQSNRPAGQGPFTGGPLG